MRYRKDIEAALARNDTRPLRLFLESGGNVPDLGCSVMGFPLYNYPFYYFPAVVKDLGLVKLLFERGMKLESDCSFFEKIADMSDEVFEWALEKEIHKTEPSSECLFHAMDHPARFMRLVESGAHTWERFSDDNPKSLLEHAIEKGNKEMVEFLVSKGENINSEVYDKYSHHTIFFLAILSRKCRVDMLELMVRLGVDYRWKSHRGNTAIMVAAGSIWPAESDAINKLKYLLSLYQGWTGEVKDDGNTALHVAARNQTGANIVSLLLERGFDPLLANEDGKTPIELCILDDNAVAFRTFWAMIQENPARFEGLRLEEMCDKYRAWKIKDMILESKAACKK